MNYTPIESEFADSDEEAAYDAWFRASIQASLDDQRPALSHDEAMAWIKERMIERGHAKPDLAA